MIKTADELGLRTAIISTESSAKNVVYGFKTVFGRNPRLHGELMPPRGSNFHSVEWRKYVEAQIRSHKLDVIIIDSLTGIPYPEISCRALNQLAESTETLILASRCPAYQQLEKDALFRMASFVVYCEKGQMSNAKQRYVSRPVDAETSPAENSDADEMDIDASEPRQSTSKSSNQSSCQHEKLIMEAIQSCSATDVTFDTIIGQTEAKKVLFENITLPSLNSNLFTGLRRQAKGALLYGPPGKLLSL